MWIKIVLIKDSGVVNIPLDFRGVLLGFNLWAADVGMLLAGLLNFGLGQGHQVQLAPGTLNLK